MRPRNVGPDPRHPSQPVPHSCEWLLFVHTTALDCHCEIAAELDLDWKTYFERLGDR